MTGREMNGEIHGDWAQSEQLNPRALGTELTVNSRESGYEMNSGLREYWVRGEQ